MVVGNGDELQRAGKPPRWWMESQTILLPYLTHRAKRTMMPADLLSLSFIKYRCSLAINPETRSPSISATFVSYGGQPRQGQWQSITELGLFLSSLGIKLPALERSKSLLRKLAQHPIILSVNKTLLLCWVFVEDQASCELPNKKERR